MANPNTKIAPRARRDDLVVQELADEVLVYDLKRHKAHCLNRTAAMVWERCDGRRSAGEIARVLGQKLGTPVDEKFVGLALRQLGERRLLEGTNPAPAGLASHSRRDLFRKAAAAGVLIPLVTSIMVPEASAQATCRDKGGACTTNAQCCPGLICDPALLTCRVPGGGSG